MAVYKELLEKRGKKFPINVAVVGAGWFGKGLIGEICRWPAMEPRLVVTRTVDKAVDAYVQAGISQSQITVARSASELNYQMSENGYVVSDKIEVISQLRDIDVVFEATGDIEIGAKTALWTIEQGIDFITISAEMDATIGFILKKLAEEKGVVYSNSDGDQPGVLARMIDEAKLLGFDIVVAGNGKGFLDYHTVPEDIMKWVRKGQNARKTTSFTDGTKQSMELAVVSNATGLVPEKRGMHGPKVTKETLVDNFLKIISREGIVDYVMGVNVNLGMTVFVIGKRNGDFVSEALDYYKMGKGPYYLFFRDHHLCFFEAPKSIADAVLFDTATIAPKGKFADVFAVAKKDLKAGQKLDGIGGYSVYGLIDRAETVREEKLLPLGLAEYAKLTCDVKRDEPITYDMVDFPEENVVLELRRRQDTWSEGGMHSGKGKNQRKTEEEWPTRQWKR
ncbi:MAG: hypothetical protein JXB29_11875 [Sedimentisphaerales bacterium]|nr:hypothetical protein [Sedimentisphaerales bacterium]